MTRYFTLATAGHVDHGKTSLIRAMTGINPDRLKEEREREMTTDLGFAHLDFVSGCGEMGSPENPSVIIGFIDVPGHGKFLKNMLAGVGGIDLALLVVAADEGVMPQTLQHIKILSLLGVRSCLLAVSKIDLSDDFERVALEVEELLSFYGIALISSVPVSAPDGRGISELKASLLEAVEKLDREGVHAQRLKQPAFLPVDRVFSKSGYGMVVTGTLVEGKLSVGDQVAIEPGDIKARVRGLESFGRSLKEASAGQRLAINLSLKEAHSVSRGQCVVAGESRPSTNLVVEIKDLGGLEFFGDEDSEPMGGHISSQSRIAKIKKTGKGARLSPQKIKLYHGSAECAGSLRWLDIVETPQGEKFVGQIALEAPLLVRPGDLYVMRYGDNGIAGGEVLLCDRPQWLSRKALLPLTVSLFAGMDDEAALPEKLGGALVQILDASPAVLVPAELQWFLRQDSLSRVLEFGLASGLLHQGAEHLVSKTLFEKCKSFLQEQIVARFARNSEGLPLESLRRLSGAPRRTLPRSLLNSILEELTAKGLIERRQDRVFLKGAAEAKGLDALAEKIIKILDEHAVLELTEIAKLTGSDLKAVKSSLNNLSKAGLCQIVSYDFAASEKTLRHGHRVLNQLWQQKREISPSEFREALATNRKYTMALLAYYDDHQITRRLNNSRVLLKSPV